MVDLNLEKVFEKVFEKCIKWVLICFNTTPYFQNIMNQSIYIRESLSRLHMKSRVLSYILNLLLRVITRLTNKSRLGKLLDYYSSARKYTQNDVFNAGTRLYKRVLNFLDKIDVDGILMPGYPTVAPQLYKSDLTQACYLMVFNFFWMPRYVQWPESKRMNTFTSQSIMTLSEEQVINIWEFLLSLCTFDSLRNQFCRNANYESWVCSSCLKGTILCKMDHTWL